MMYLTENLRRKGEMRSRLGFTLLELLVVVAVVAILVAIALPSYSAHIRKGRRAAAETHLMDIAQRQQQYFLDTRGYASSVAALNLATPSDVSDYYVISITTAAGPPPAFTAKATPDPAKDQAVDLGGAALTVDSTGAKSPAGAW
jgi:type IV pilus assembly protein PilE